MCNMTQALVVIMPLTNDLLMNFSDADVRKKISLDAFILVKYTIFDNIINKSYVLRVFNANCIGYACLFYTVLSVECNISVQSVLFCVVYSLALYIVPSKQIELV